jgi:hypothetical protein
VRKREIISAKTKNPAPEIADNGISLIGSEPNISLII